MRSWHFIRHGESTANQEGWLAGQQNVQLTAAGRAQTSALAMLMAGQGGMKIAQLWSSDLSRAIETAETLRRYPGALHLPEGVVLQQSEALRERDAGDWTHLLRDKLPRTEIDKMRAWDFAPPNGESMAMMAARVVPLLAQIESDLNALQSEESDVLIVSHGGLMRVMIGLLDQMGVERIGSLGYGNCEVITRDAERDVWAMLAKEFA